MLTQEDLKLFEQMCSPAQGPDVIFMNPRDYADLKRWFACEDYLKQLENRCGRRLSGIERRWFTAKFYKKKCEPRFVDRIPFPEEP